MSQNRPSLPMDRVRPEVRAAMAGFHADVVREVESAIEQNRVVIVGMVGNPFVKKARKALQNANIPFKYLEFGGYLSQWKPRLAIKLWSGWPTFPQVFVGGELIGGFEELTALLQAGELKS